MLEKDPNIPGTWTKAGNSSALPPRQYNSMVYDSTNRVHLIFGGGELFSSLNDTWIYDISLNKWTDCLPASSPSPRTGYAMAFHERNGVTVLFGGYSENKYMGDTWAYNLTLNTWTEKKSAIAPQPRDFHSMAYDPVSDRIVLFGGNKGSSSSLFSDTWTYDYSNNTWTERTTTKAPPPRFKQSMCYDPTSGLIILFGGSTGYDGRKGDTWTYNPATNAWTECYVATHPFWRSGAAMAACPSSGTVFLFGGESHSSSIPSVNIWYNDTWSFNVSNNVWTNMSTTVGPSPRSSPGMTYDPSSKGFFLCGGDHDIPLADYWKYDPAQNRWTILDEVSSPVPRSGSSFAYDRASQVGVLFGGYNYNNWNDTWIYTVPENKWEKRYPELSPTPRMGAAMCYDRDTGLMVLFGGGELNFNDRTDYWTSNDFDDTWTYNVSANIWMNRQPVQHPHEFQCMAYDPDSHLVILVGMASWDAPGIETWTYDVIGNLWTNRTKPGAPSARGSSEIVYDETCHMIVLFGGNNINGSVMGDTWTYNTSSFSWSLMSPDFSPPARTGHAMVFDNALGAVLLFGGTGRNRSVPYGDTWAYNASANTWRNLTSAVSPDPRCAHGLFYDSNTKTTVLFGGYLGDYRLLGDTWQYGGSGRFTSGSYTSIPKDTGGSAFFGAMYWEGLTPPDTNLKLQLRTGTSQADMLAKDFTGADGTIGSYFIASGQRIPSMHNGSRWIQYRVYLTTDDVNRTPTLFSITINYNLLQSVSITSPAGGENWTGTQSINWSLSDPDNDPLSLDIYLLNSSKSTRLVGRLSSESRQWLWNTSGVPNGTYKILITASDKNPSIPLMANATSGDFVIYHPDQQPTNHPPHITLISPANNSYLPTTSARLQWIGTDPDGDPLTYSVHYSDRPFSQGTILTNITVAEAFDLANLTDNKTYYWTVDGTDGKSNGTDVSTDIWSFTVRLPPANIPVRIISAPSLQAWVGKEYAYNLTSVDEDGDIPAYALIWAPSNITLDPSTGRLRWTPTTADIGNHTVTIQVSDGRGSFDNQTFTIEVLDIPVLPPVAPQCTIQYPANGSRVNGTVQIRGTALNGSLPITIVQIRIDDGAWQTAVGLDSWSITINAAKLAKGKHRIDARAFDANLISDTASVEIVVNNPEPGVSTGGNTWCLPAIIIAVVAGLSVLLLLRKKIGKT